MKNVTIVKEVDKVDENLELDLNLRQTGFTTWFLSNIFDRAFSYLVGWTGTAARMLRCTTAGVLRVAVEGGAYETNDTRAGTAGAAWSGAIIPDNTAMKVEVWNGAQPINIRLSNNLFGYNDAINLAANSYYEVEASIAQMGIQRSGAVDSTYQIVFWF